jgi:phosphoribosylformylglycinamidine synthase
MTVVAGDGLNCVNIQTADLGMSPMQIWCNEAQERYVIAITPQSLPLFKSFFRR